MKEVITLEDVISWKPCWDEVKLKEYAQGRRSENILTLLRDEELKLDERIWLAIYAMLPRERRLFACACAERALEREEAAGRIVDPRSREVIRAARLYAEGGATISEMRAAWYAARSAAWDEACSAAFDAVRHAAWDAARSAAKYASWSTAWDVALDAVWSAARHASWDAAWDAARSAASSAARYASWSAAWDASWYAASSAARDASHVEAGDVVALEAERRWQLEWIIENML